MTGQGCQAASQAGLLQEVGPGSFLCGGRQGWGSGLLALAHAPHPTHTSRVQSSHCDEPQKMTSAQQLPYLLLSPGQPLGSSQAGTR